MRAPISWIREYVDIPADQTGRDIAARLIENGLEVETVETVGAGIAGPIVIGRIESIEELTEFKKPIRFCIVEVGESHGAPDTPGRRGIVCGARNFQVDDLVVAALPGAVLPGDFVIASRETYGRTSDGMLCSSRELGLGEDHSGIIVLTQEPGDSLELGSDARPLLGIGEEVLDIAVTPDRGYCLSIRGIAREAALNYGLEFRDPADGPDGPALEGAEPGAHPLEIQDPLGADVFTLRSLDGFDPSAQTPAWMTRRLALCGMRPVSLAVDVTNYVMLELGQPLHAFDGAKVQGALGARRAYAGETLVTLDHVERALDPDDLVITDDRGPIGLAGTMGGLHTEIEESSTAILLEAAHFAPVSVARMSRRHKLSSEASRRFERGVDPALPRAASDRAARLLSQLGGARIGGISESGRIDAPQGITFPIDLASRISGAQIERDEVMSAIRGIGAQVLDHGETLHVMPPSWRPDVSDPIDLVEEVVRLHGFANLPSTLPTPPAGRGLTMEQRLRRRAGLAMAAMGFTEVLNYPFVSATEMDALLLPAGERPLVPLANPLSEEQPYLRSTLLLGLTGAAKRNLSRGAEGLALFEIGSCIAGHVAESVNVPRPSVSSRPSEAELDALESLLPDQGFRIGWIATGAIVASSWWGTGRNADWGDAIEPVERLAQVLGVALTVAQGAHPSWHPGRCAEIAIGDIVVGHGGELHPRACAALGLPERTVATELDLGAVMANAVAVTPAPEFSNHPVVKEDIALVVDASMPSSRVSEVLKAASGGDLESVRLFDVYQGEQVPEGKKSLAFALRFRSAERTLSHEDVASLRNLALDAVRAELGAELR